MRGDLTEQDADAIVNPANSYGLMGGGVAYDIREAGGRSIEDEARAKAPVPVGEAVATSAGALRCRHVIHAPTMTEPAERTTPANVAAAVKAALRVAEGLSVRSIAFPGMGCGVGGVAKTDAARAMVEAVLEYAPDYTVYLIGFDDELTREFERWLAALSQGR